MPAGGRAILEPTDRNSETAPMAASRLAFVWDYDIDEAQFRDLLSGRESLGSLDRDWAAVRLLEYALVPARFSGFLIPETLVQRLAGLARSSCDRSHAAADSTFSSSGYPENERTCCRTTPVDASYFFDRLYPLQDDGAARCCRASRPDST